MRRMIMMGTVGVILAAVPVGAATYQWRDDAGVVHFTDDSERIPDRYLKRATETDAAPKEAKPAAAQSVSAPAPAAGAGKGTAAAADTAKTPERARLSAELAQLRAALVGKQKELERLHHKWLVAKGRTPTVEEAKAFQKQLAEGKTTDEKNPYVNKNKALSSAAPARAAYHKKLAEVRADKARVLQLEQELEALK